MEETTDMKNKQNFLTEVRTHLDAGERRPKHFKRVKLLGRISPTGLILISAALAIGMLSGLLYTTFYVQVHSEIELTGAVVPLFYFDGQPFDNQWFNTTADITTLNAGDTVTVSHTIENADAYAWNLSFAGEVINPASSWKNDPMHEWYGFNFTATPSDWLFIPGETITVDFIYSLHPEFVGTLLPLDFNLTVFINRTNAPPVGTEDDVVLEYNTPTAYYVLANDFDYENDDLEITSVSTPLGTATVTNGGQTITLQYGGGGDTTFDVSYWLTDNQAGHDPVGPILVHVTYHTQ